MSTPPTDTSLWRRRPVRTVVASTLATLTVLALGAGPSRPASAASLRSHSLTQPALYGVGIRRCTFIDSSRHVLNYSTTPASIFSPARTLVTEIRYPTPLSSGEPGEAAGAAPEPRVGGYPLIVFAHGYDVTPDTYAKLLDAWTRAGFVVAAPFFPDEQPSAISAQHGVNTEGDLANEPEDLAFVTRQIQAASTTASPACPVLNGLVRDDQVALAGHSDGGNAVAMLAFSQGRSPQGTTFAHERAGIDYRAVMIFSGDEASGQAYATQPSRPNLLIVQSLTDQCNPIRYGVQLYDAIHQPNKWFLELQAAHHMPPFDGVDVSAFKAVAASTTRFLQISLDGETFPTRLLTFANQQPSVARMSTGGRGPSLAHAPTLEELCGMD